MKLLRALTLPVAFAMVFCTSALSLPDSGFLLPDSVREMTLHYRSMKNLIILPVLINNLPVNLILDTGCRNLVLFGKKFEKLLKITPSHTVKFSGLGSGKPVYGSLSLGNKITIQQVLGENIPVVVVGERNVFRPYGNIDGVIGFDIFFKFEIEINSKDHVIKFRSAEECTPPHNFSNVPLRIMETRPVIDSRLFIESEGPLPYDLMIDTGSTMGLLIKTRDLKKFRNRKPSQTIGFGFNGPLKGYETTSGFVNLRGMQMSEVPTGVVECQVAEHASLGMSVLSEYVVVINYLKKYVCFKKVEV